MPVCWRPSPPKRVPAVSDRSVILVPRKDSRPLPIRASRKGLPPRGAVFGVISMVPPSASASCSGRLDLVTVIAPTRPVGIASNATARPPPNGVALFDGGRRRPPKVVLLRSASRPRILMKRPSPVSVSSEMPGMRRTDSAMFTSGSLRISLAVIRFTRLGACSCACRALALVARWASTTIT